MSFFAEKEGSSISSNVNELDKKYTRNNSPQNRIPKAFYSDIWQ